MNPGELILDPIHPAPSADGPESDPERLQRLIERLEHGLADRRGHERELASLQSSVDVHAQWRLQTTLEQLAAARDSAQAGIDERTAEERHRIETALDREREQIERLWAAAVAQIEQRATDETARIEKKCHDDSWLVSSLTDDSSEESPKFQFERLRTQIEQTRGNLTSMCCALDDRHAATQTLIEQRRLRLAPLPPPGVMPASREELVSRFRAAAESVEQQATAIVRLVVPRALGGWSPLWISVLFTAALATLIWLAVNPAWFSATLQPGLEWAAIVGGISLGSCAVFWLLIWLIAAQQTAPLADEMQQSLSDARAAWGDWQRTAENEIRRAEQDAVTRHAAIVERRERSLARFTADRDSALAETAARREADLARATQARDTSLRSAIERSNDALLQLESSQRREMTAIRLQHDRESARRTAEYQQQHQMAEQRQVEVLQQYQTGWQTLIADLQTQAETWSDESRTRFPEWSTILADTWRPAESVSPGIRLGDFEIDLTKRPGGLPIDSRVPTAQSCFRLPALWPFPLAPSLLLTGPVGATPAAVSLLQTAMLRLLAQAPPGTVRFTIIDPVGLGENFAGFMNLADYDDLLVTSRIWTESAHIDQQLANLTEHMETVFQKYLRNEFDSIEDYNRQAGEVAEPYRVLVVAGFPAGFSEKSAQRLVSIATKGARCGVATLILYDTRRPLPHGFNLDEIAEAATVLEWEEGAFVCRAIGTEPLVLRPDAPPPPARFAQLVRKLGELSKDVRRVEVPFGRIVPPADRYWTEDSRSQIRVPLGRSGATKLQFLQLGKGTSQHVLIAGKTGSGKSTLLNVIITDLALRYSPEELEFYLIDFKKGVEFKTYAAHQLPHARAIAIESDREFGVSVLERLDRVLKERGELFRTGGVQDVASYRQANPQQIMPRILLVVDEFQEFFVEDDRYAQQAALLLDRLVRQGRAFGIHVLLGSQTLGGSYSLPRTTLGQMAVRIALQCSEADAHLILSEDNSAARLLTRPGEAIYNDANGLVEGNNPFQIAWLDDLQRDEYLQRVADLAGAQGRGAPDQVVFEGNVPADPLQNAAWRKVVESSTADQLPGPAADGLPRAWLGEAVAITGPTSVSFARRSGANLLVIGQESAGALGILANALVTLAAGGPACESSRRAWLLTEAAGPEPDGRWSRIRAVLPGQTTLTGSGECPAVIAELYAELSRRKAGATAAGSWFLVIDDLAQFRELRKGDEDFGFGSFDRKDAAPTPAAMFAEILRDGPALGMHALVWCDSYNNVDRWFSRQTLREFEMRVLFQMSATDSSNLIDNPAASRLGVNRALLYSDERGTLEKFRPYGAPGHSWLRWLSQRFGGAASARLEVADDINLWTVS